MLFSSYALDDDDIADLLANHVTQVGADLVISYGADELTIIGLAKANLTEDDFIFLS